jgi:hypothetical protein
MLKMVISTHLELNCRIETAHVGQIVMATRKRLTLTKVQNLAGDHLIPESAGVNDEATDHALAELSRALSLVESKIHALENGNTPPGVNLNLELKYLFTARLRIFAHAISISANLLTKLGMDDRVLDSIFHAIKSAETGIGENRKKLISPSPDSNNNTITKYRQRAMICALCEQFRVHRSDIYDEAELWGWNRKKLVKIVEDDQNGNPNNETYLDFRNGWSEIIKCDVFSKELINFYFNECHDYKKYKGKNLDPFFYNIGEEIFD